MSNPIGVDVGFDLDKVHKALGRLLDRAIHAPVGTKELAKTPAVEHNSPTKSSNLANTKNQTLTNSLDDE